MNKTAIFLMLVMTACVVQQIPAGNMTTTPDETPVVVVNETSEQTPPPSTVEEQLENIEVKALPTKEFKEGELVQFPNLKATDPDGDPITYTFSSPLNERGEWQTKEGDRGSYLVTITASDGQNVVTQDVRVTVVPENYEPELRLSASTISVNEGEEVIITATTNDKDGDAVGLEIRGWMDSLRKQTDYNDAGTHSVVVIASDGKDSVTEEVTVNVANVNRAPSLTQPPSISVLEGETVIVVPSASDQDADQLSYEFSEPLDQDGTWETQKGDSGERTATITVSDGELIDTKTVRITVEEVNLPPVITVEHVFRFDEGSTAVTDYTATDPEGEVTEVSFSGWMTANTKQLGYNDAGTHDVTLTASDGKKTSTATISVVVKDKNRPPSFAIGSFD
ncbi:MAG: Ig-like domain-containing protein [Candidatus Woesearchaeota archaeon]|jgi:hypothetical protein|nr:Ig-like domain-containing protein [Candidatus Woesearchaeota archaeon]